MTTARRTRLIAQRDQALDDLLALEEQLESGEITPEDAAPLQRRYEAEAADAFDALDRLDEEPEAGRSPRRVAIGVTGFVIVASIVTFAVVAAVEPRPEGGFVTGGVASDVVSDNGAIDLSTITNEQMEEVIAQNPDVLPMRLALARRYVEDGDFSAALDHYLYVLEREESPEALMYLGWMTYASGEADTGVALLERSLELDPGHPLAQWFLANALLYGIGDAEAAIPLLEAVIDSGLAPADVTRTAEQMLEEARS